MHDTTSFFTSRKHQPTGGTESTERDKWHEMSLKKYFIFELVSKTGKIHQVNHPGNLR